MRKRRYTEVQIVAILKELDAGRPAAELARKHGVHVNTLRLWRSKYGGLDISDLSRLKELESENGQMERIIARQAVQSRDVGGNPKKRVGPSARKEAVRALQAEGLSERQASRLAGCPRPTARYRSCKEPDDEFIRDRLRCLAQERPRFGWRRLKILLKREGIILNHKRLRRLYREECLQVRPAQTPRSLDSRQRLATADNDQ